MFSDIDSCVKIVSQMKGTLVYLKSKRTETEKISAAVTITSTTDPSIDPATSTGSGNGVVQSDSGSGTGTGAGAATVAVEMTELEVPLIYAVPRESGQQLIRHLVKVLKRSMTELKVWDPALGAPDMPAEILALLQEDGEDNTGKEWEEYLKGYKSPVTGPDPAGTGMRGVC